MMASEDIQALVRKGLVALLAGLLVLVLLTALVVGGFVMLLKAVTLGLSPWVGEAGAHAIAGAACLLVIGLIFRKLLGPTRRKVRSKAGAEPEGVPNASVPPEPRAPLDNYRTLIRKHPFEAVAASFTLGMSQYGDPRLRELLMETGLDYLKSADAAGPEPTAAPPETADATDPPAQ